MDTNNSPIAIDQIRVGRQDSTECDAAMPLTSLKIIFAFVQYTFDREIIRNCIGIVFNKYWLMICAGK